MEHRKSQHTRKTPHVNLPRCGLFQASEVKAASIPWQEHSKDDMIPRVDSNTAFVFRCFLCEAPLTGTGGKRTKDTREDVFPQWLQRQFGLQNQRCAIADPNSRLYSEILIPACAQCNNEYLSKFESRLAKALTAGIEQFVRLRKADVFLWCGKIHYGAIHSDVVPRHPVTREPQQARLPQLLLDDLAFLRLLLQGFRKRVVIFGVTEPPYSVLLFKLYCGRDPGYYFQVRQAMQMPGIALQLGPIGIIVVCDDYGLTNRVYNEHFQSIVGDHFLHPVQFWEMAGRLLYASYRNPVHTSFTLARGPRDMILTLEPRPDTELPFSYEEEARWISLFTGGPTEEFWDSRRLRRLSLIAKSDGSFNDMPFIDISPS
jgi:hypothetical protein